MEIQGRPVIKISLSEAKKKFKRYESIQSCSYGRINIDSFISDGLDSLFIGNKDSVFSDNDDPIYLVVKDKDNCITTLTELYNSDVEFVVIRDGIKCKVVRQTFGNHIIKLTWDKYNDAQKFNEDLTHSENYEYDIVKIIYPDKVKVEPNIIIFDGMKYTAKNIDTMLKEMNNFSIMLNDLQFENSRLTNVITNRDSEIKQLRSQMSIFSNTTFGKPSSTNITVGLCSCCGGKILRSDLYQCDTIYKCSSCGNKITINK